jgi:hypothetical protein
MAKASLPTGNRPSLSPFGYSRRRQKAAACSVPATAKSEPTPGGPSVRSGNTVTVYDSTASGSFQNTSTTGYAASSAPSLEKGSGPRV